MKDRLKRDWRSYTKSYINFAQSTKDVLSQVDDRVSMVKYGFSQGDTGASLYIASSLSPDELILIMDELVNLTLSHGYAGKAREIITKIPKDWLLLNIANYTESILESGVEEDYRRVMELYFEIDRDLTETLIQSVLNHQDEEIQEIGREFHELI